jgi:hypothetical protein
MVRPPPFGNTNTPSIGNHAYEKFVVPCTGSPGVRAELESAAKETSKALNEPDSGRKAFK